MSNIVISGAGYGDESSWADVTSTLQKMLKQKGYLNVIADKSLIPSSEESVSVTDTEKEDILKQAQTQCGGGSDKKCIDERVDTLTRGKLAEKADETKIPKGEKLTIALFENGKYVVKHIAKGQPFTLGKLPEKADAPKPAEPSNETGVTGYLLYAVLLFVWGLNVLLTWMTFRSSTTYVRYGTTAVAAVFPPSGFLMVLVYYLLIIYKQRQNA